MPQLSAGLIDKAIEAEVQAIDLFGDTAGRVTHRGGVIQRPTGRQATISGLKILELMRLERRPLGLMACRERFADTGRAIAQTNIAVTATGLTKFSKAPVFLGYQERGRLSLCQGLGLIHCSTVSTYCG